MSIDWIKGLDLSTLSSVIIPVVIFFMKGIWAKIPRWCIPAVASGLGIVANFLIALSTGGTVEPIVGFLAGLLGVGIREFLKQAGNKLTEDKGTY